MQKMLCFEEAQEALDKAKVHLMTKPGAQFLCSVSLLLEHKLSKDFPTAATNGKEVIYNPEFFLGLSKEERIGLIAHEVWHVAFMHMFRIGSKDKKLWNIAGDYVINNLLVENNFKVPKGGFVDPQFTGWSTEQVYDYLLENQPDSEEFSGDLLEPESTEDNREGVTNIIVRAVQQAQMQAGKIPNEIEVSIEKLINPKLNWKELLQRFIDTKIKDNSTWRKPNRKYYPNFYLPSIYSDKLDNITVAIDTSGSITDEFLQEILSEIQYINETLKPNTFTVLDCDYKIHNIYEVDNEDNILTYKFSGRGGTLFSPVIKYCEDRNTNLLIYFTDLDGPQITKEPSYPILWVCYSNHEPALVGETIYVNL